MKASLILAVVLLCIPGLAWAEEPAPAVSEDVAFEAGGCVLPDVSGLSGDEAAAALAGAGFETAPFDAAVPACPTTFHCDSIFNCGTGAVCSVTDIGACCATGGLVKCCISGTIKVRQCPCVCTGNPCSIACPQSTDVRSRCT